ncbi:hypothetical protein ACKFKG_15565 [Phormidesmis sp. 146-35]
MVFQVPPSAIAASKQITDHPRCRILKRTQYRSCHIQIPDDSQRLAAICVEEKYYSFFKLIKDHPKTLQVAARLVYRGNEVMITQTAKGDVLWVYEPDAQTKTLPCESANRHSEDGLWRILNSSQQYQVCQIRVPDVAKPLEAIVVDHKYYGFMRRLRTENEAIEFANRLAKKGNESMITKSDRACAIWILEPDATLNQ